MDFDSSSKFISSLAKFLQSLCNGYVEFNSGVEVIGHIYLSVDTGKKIDYILNEKVCKTDENSVTFISNSFHAQPAEKPKPPGKSAPTSDPVKPSDTGGQADEEDIIIMDEPESKNTGTIPTRDSYQRPHPNSQSKINRPPKRSFNQSFSSSHKQPSKHSRYDSLSSGPNGAQLDSDSLHSESNNPTNFLPSQLVSDTTIMAATESDISHLSKVFPQNFNDNQSVPEERDIKPQLDSEMKIIQVKQEYDQSGHGGEEDQESFDEPKDPSGLYSGMPYDQYYGEGGRRGQRSDYSGIGGMGPGEYFPGGAGPSGDITPGDSSVPSLQSLRGRRRISSLSSSSALFSLSPNSVRVSQSSASCFMPPQISDSPNMQISLGKKRRIMNFACEICGKRLPSRREFVGHMNGRHLGQKPFSCELCGRQFAYITSLPMHRKTCPAAQLARLNSMNSPSNFSTVPEARDTLETPMTYQVNSRDTSELKASLLPAVTPEALSFSTPPSASETDIVIKTDI